jgi:uncharacterized protein (TIGR02284 family)
MERDEVVAVLNDLIETCRDGQEGFRDAAEHVKDPLLRHVFAELSAQRAQFAAVLQDEVKKLGEEPPRRGSLAGAAHRGWINLKSALVSSHDHLVVAEAERGEDVAVDTYREALEEPLPADIRSIVESQFEQIKAAHDRVRSFEAKTNT